MPAPRPAGRAARGARHLGAEDVDGGQRRLREQRWRSQLEHLVRDSPFFARLWNSARPAPQLAAIAELPFCDKAMLRADQAAHPPFGSYLASPAERIARVHRTSGTTGQAMNLALSRADAALSAEVAGRAQRCAGLGPGHRVVHCLNYQLWMGGLTDHLGLEATGATVIPFGVGSTARLIETIRELGVTAISCTPSYPAVLERVIAAEFPGLAPRDLGLRLGLFGGEAGLDDPALRARLEATWGFQVRNSNYGVSDVLCNFAAQCQEQADLHLLAGDVLHAELVEPHGERVLPWREGERGELVLTHLVKECQPLVRFRTGDLITLTATGRCACGRDAPRFRVSGRSDEMVVVRGINCFPTMIGAVISTFPELAPEYRVVLRGDGPYDALPLVVEVAEGQVPREALAARLGEAIKHRLGVSAEVRLVAAGHFPRTAGKTRRVVREPEEPRP